MLSTLKNVASLLFIHFNTILIMKFIKVLYLLACILILSSCNSAVEKPRNFKLLPQPQEFEIIGTSDLKPADLQYVFSKEKVDLPKLGTVLQNIKKTNDPSKAQISYEVDASLDVKDEGYTFDISKDKIKITAKDRAGLLYAFMTLEQLCEDAIEQEVALPMTHVKDYPLLAYRAIQLDMKHHMEKTEYYYQLLDKLARYKVNGVIAEMEDKIAYKRQPLIGSDDALSIDEWKKLSDYAKERNIEISPLIQGLGHSSFVLKLDEYKDLRDDPTSDWAYNPLDPKTYEVQFDMYLDAIEATPHGKYLHVGGDEVHTTGRNSGKSALELQLGWLNKVSEFAEKHNRIPIFWDDMPLKQAGVYKAMFNTDLTEIEVDSIWAENEHKLLEFLDLFPKNCIYMRWNYSHSEAIGNDRAMAWFRKNGLKVMGATAGQTRWVLMPQEESNMNNIKAFAKTSINNDLNGLLLTLWDDDSPHFELYNRGIIAFSEYTWSGENRSKSDLKSAYRHREFSNALSDTTYAFIDDLEQPVAFWKNALLKGNKRNYLTKQQDPIAESVIDFPDKNNKGTWSKKYAKRLEKAKNTMDISEVVSSKINDMQAKAIRNNYTLEVYEQVNKLVQFSSRALLLLSAYDMAQNETEEKAAMKKLKNLPREFEALRKELEAVYAKTRILTKPSNYILAPGHHVHLANQSINFDWQFYAEMSFLEKLKNEDFEEIFKQQLD